MMKNLAIELTAQGEWTVRKGHPWIFSNSIVKSSSNPETGDLAIIFSKKKNRVIAIGLYDADSPIRIKIIHRAQTKAEINGSYFHSKMELAFQKRKPLLQTNTNSYRLLYGENDGFPSLIVDIYHNVAVIKLYACIWESYFQDIINSIVEIAKVEAVVLRLSRSLMADSKTKFEDGQVLYGTLKEPNVEFLEYGVKFSANVLKGHKTGFFLDHRQNRNHIGKLSKGKTVLDVFSYAGGFSVHALVNGATEVTSLDISAKALEVAVTNANLNDFEGSYATLNGDAFKIMGELINKRKSFDVVVIDPPSFAKQKSEIAMAKKKYRMLAELGINLTAKNGLLVLASCSSRIVAQSFFDINRLAIDDSARSYELIKTTFHDIDHPITFPEAAYLKTGYYRFRDYD